MGGGNSKCPSRPANLAAGVATRPWAVAAGALVIVATFSAVPARLWAQESRPTRAPQPVVEEVPPQPPVPAPEPADGRSRTGSLPPRTRSVGTGGGFPGGMAPRMMPSAMRPPTEVAPARFEATVLEVQIPENRIADLDAQALETKADTAQSLAKALADFGPTKTLYKVDQTVNLFGESITLGTSQPMVTGTRMTDSGQAINSITYQQVGLVINLSANPAPPDAPKKVPDTQVDFHLAVLADSAVELAPKVKASSTRNVELSHSETPRFGKACVLLNASAASGSAATPATAYVVRYVFSETKP